MDEALQVLDEFRDEANAIMQAAQRSHGTGRSPMSPLAGRVEEALLLRRIRYADLRVE